MSRQSLLLGLLVLAVLADGVHCHHQANMDSDKPRLRGGGCGPKTSKHSSGQPTPAANPAAKPAPVSTGSIGTRTVGVANATQRKELLDELASAGIKHNPAAVVGIDKIGGRIVFLEKGTSTAGLQHIVKEHGAQFAKRGIAEADIPEALFTALRSGTRVGTQSRNRPIYEFVFKGTKQRAAITVGDNGYIVGANPSR